jgi:peroxiredoxin
MRVFAQHKITRMFVSSLIALAIFDLACALSFYRDPAPRILPEHSTHIPNNIAKLPVLSLRAEPILFSSLYAQKPILLAVYLGAGCPMCVMTLQLLSQHAERIRGYGWDLVAISKDSPEDNQIALERPKGDSSFTQPGGAFSIALYSDTNHIVMEALRCYRRATDTERHGLFLIDMRGEILYDTIDRRPIDDLEPVIERIRLARQNPYNAISKNY